MANTSSAAMYVYAGYSSLHTPDRTDEQQKRTRITEKILLYPVTEILTYGEIFSAYVCMNSSRSINLL
jgi:hypothetical protein